MQAYNLCWNCGLHHLARDCDNRCMRCGGEEHKHCLCTTHPCYTSRGRIVTSTRGTYTAALRAGEIQFPIQRAYPGYDPIIYPHAFLDAYREIVLAVDRYNAAATWHFFSEMSVDVREVMANVATGGDDDDEDEEKIPLNEESRKVAAGEADGDVQSWEMVPGSRVELRFKNHPFIANNFPLGKEREQSKLTLNQIRREGIQTDNAFWFLRSALSQPMMHGGSTDAYESANHQHDEKAPVFYSAPIKNVLIAISGVELFQFGTVPHEFIVVENPTDAQITIRFRHSLGEEFMNSVWGNLRTPDKTTWQSLSGGVGMRAQVPTYYMDRTVHMVENYFKVSGILPERGPLIEDLRQGARDLVNQGPPGLAQVLRGERQLPEPDYAYGHAATSSGSNLSENCVLTVPRQAMFDVESTGKSRHWPYCDAEIQGEMAAWFLKLLQQNEIIPVLEGMQADAAMTMLRTGVHVLNGIAGGGKSTISIVVAAFHGFYRGCVYLTARTHQATNVLLQMMVDLLWSMDNTALKEEPQGWGNISQSRDWRQCTVFGAVRLHLTYMESVDNSGVDNAFNYNFRPERILRAPYAMVLRKFPKGFHEEEMSLPSFKKATQSPRLFANWNRVYNPEYIRFFITTEAHSPTPRKTRPSMVIKDEAVSSPLVESLAFFGNVITRNIEQPKKNCYPSAVHAVNVVGDPRQVKSHFFQSHPAYDIPANDKQLGAMRSKNEYPPDVDLAERDAHAARMRAKDALRNLHEECLHVTQIFVGANVEKWEAIQLDVSHRAPKSVLQPIFEVFYPDLEVKYAAEGDAPSSPWVMFDATPSQTSIVVDIRIGRIPNFIAEELLARRQLNEQDLELENRGTGLPLLPFRRHFQQAGMATQLARDYILAVVHEDEQHAQHSDLSGLFPTYPLGFIEQGRFRGNCNSFEAAAIFRACLMLRTNGVNMREVGIISPFADQVSHLRRLMHREFPLWQGRPSIMTIGHAMGREWPYTMTSFVIMDWKERRSELLADDIYAYMLNPKWNEGGTGEDGRPVDKYIRFKNAPRPLVGTTRAKIAQLMFISNAQDLISDETSHEDYGCMRALVRKFAEKELLVDINMDGLAVKVRK